MKNFFNSISFFTVLIITIISCNSKVEKNEPLQNTKESQKLKIEAESQEQLNKKPIDSLKMHAFDNLYFGLNPGTTIRDFEIDNIPYSVVLSKAEPGEGVFYYMLKSRSKITTIIKAKSVVNSLKKIIATKHKNFLVLNQTYNSKHPEEKKVRQSSFEERAEGEYDKNIVDKPFEFAAYKWNLKYKTIQIGYFINNKQREVFMQSTPKTDEYIIYIELVSKLIVSKEVIKANKNDDANKF